MSNHSFLSYPRKRICICKQSNQPQRLSSTRVESYKHGNHPNILDSRRNLQSLGKT